MNPEKLRLSWEAEFLGVHAHDCAFPWDKRDGTEAMMLAIQGLQFLNIHVPDSVRIHHAIQAASGTPGTRSRAYARMRIDVEFMETLPEDLPYRIKNLVVGAGMIVGVETLLTPAVDDTDEG